jgi:UDP-N-acetylmuramate--alanine ligase
MRNVPFYGLLVACVDHPVVADMVARLDMRTDGRRLLTYGTQAGADIVLGAHRQNGHVSTYDAELSARVAGGQRTLRGLELPLPGRHNALNSLAAIAVAAEAGISDDLIRSGLASFSGVKRRFQPTGTWNGVSIYDDYGHHPAEIAAVMQAARAGAKGRVIAVFEPHRYTRIRDLFGEFATCFREADSVVVGPLYSAGEQPIVGIDNHSIADAIRASGHPSVLAIDSPTELIGLVGRYGRADDMVVFLGAGTSTEWAHALPEWLAEQPRLAGE